MKNTELLYKMIKDWHGTEAAAEQELDKRDPATESANQAN
jgi:hypothetical protein